MVGQTCFRRFQLTAQISRRSPLGKSEGPLGLNLWHKPGKAITALPKRQKIAKPARNLTI
jgi:hypothetical protein